MYMAVVEFPRDKAVFRALEVVRSSTRFSVKLSLGKVVVEAKDATALRAALTSILRILQACERLQEVVE